MFLYRITVVASYVIYICGVLKKTSFLNQIKVSFNKLLCINYSINLYILKLCLLLKAYDNPVYSGLEHGHVDGCQTHN